MKLEDVPIYKRTFHKINILDIYFDLITKGLKTFEIRKNDRDYRIGDLVQIVNLSTMHWVFCEILYITDYEQKENYIVFSFKILSNSFEAIGINLK